MCVGGKLKLLESFGNLGRHRGLILDRVYRGQLSIQAPAKMVLGEVEVTMETGVMGSHSGEMSLGRGL